ncbi:AAA family ATPase [Candidatus Poriferisodalis sp.]|uniref:AAA family ATPase n=1 Tax=Candidatus Poriferisodalis sp. TaxID=3101277 RepID=UPI003B5246E3
MDNKSPNEGHEPPQSDVSSGSVTLDSVAIRGFRSLADVELGGLGGVTVLIGANGSGKSNFVRFFEMLGWMLRSRRLEQFVNQYGGADDQLFMGNKVTPRMEADIRLKTQSGLNEYSISLSYGAPDRFIFSDERWRFSDPDKGLGLAPWNSAGSGHTEARIDDAAKGHISDVNPTTARVVCNLLRDCHTFQFHDTSLGAAMKRPWDMSDNRLLRSDGGNLAAVLLRLRDEYPDHYEWVQGNIRRILPNFDQFLIEERHGKAILRWRATDWDKTFGAHLTSDGSLRFFALVTLLNLPSDMLPKVIVLDEPELGLHPAAVSLIGSMIESVSDQCQVIVATQSPHLVDAFDLSEIVVMELENSKTAVRRLDRNDYLRWLEENYTTGELWQMNLLGGRP